MCKNMEPREDFWQKRNKWEELCTGGRKLGEATGNEAGKISRGQIAESMIPGSSMEKGRRE